MSKPSISIRVKLPDENEQTFEEGEVVTILWDRVIAAALLVTLMLGLLLLGWQYWRSMESLETPVKLHSNTPIKQPLTDGAQKAPASGKSLTANKTSLATTETQENQQAKSTGQISPSEKTAANSIVEANTISDVEKPATAHSTPTSNLQTDTLAGNTAATVDEDKSQIAATQSAPKATETATPPKSQVGTTKPSPTINYDTHAASVDVFSRSILQARLTTELNNRVPQSDAPSVLTVDDSALLTVYFFTEIKGFRATPVFFDWYRNDTRVARVRIRPKYETTPILSSKYINQNMSGDWRVELRSEGGKTLAASQFTVIKQQDGGVAQASHGR